MPGTQQTVRYSEHYAIADYVIARKFCTEVMRFRQGHSHLYVIVRFML